MTTKTFRRPLHEKVREQLRARYLDGSCDALPSLRELSRTLEINHATVSRALRDLESEGAVEVVPRKGIFPTSRAAAFASGGAQNIELVVLYDVLHEQMEVAQPVFEGMCRASLNESEEQDVASTREYSHEAKTLGVTRSVVPISPVPDAARFVAQAQARETAGIVFVGYGYLDFPQSHEESQFIYEVSRQMPVVLAGMPHAQLKLDSVYCDPRPQMREFLNDCYEEGLRRYEFIGSGIGLPHQEERHETFADFLLHNGLKWKRAFLEEQPVEVLAARLRDAKKLPEVVVATNMSRAITVALEAQRRGLKLPDDLKLLCFASSSRDAQTLLPYANIIFLDEPQVGARALQIIGERLKNRFVSVAEKTPPRTESVAAHFISRH